MMQGGQFNQIRGPRPGNAGMRPQQYGGGVRAQRMPGGMGPQGNIRQQMQQGKPQMVYPYAAAAQQTRPVVQHPQMQGHPAMVSQHAEPLNSHILAQAPPQVRILGPTSLSNAFPSTTTTNF